MLNFLASIMAVLWWFGIGTLLLYIINPFLNHWFLSNWKGKILGWIIIILWPLVPVFCLIGLAIAIVVFYIILIYFGLRVIPWAIINIYRHGYPLSIHGFDLPGKKIRYFRKKK